MANKRLIILKHGGGELANQLWNYLSIYAYGLETGLPVRNPSFFEYHYFFRFLRNESLVTQITSRLLFRTPRRRKSLINRNQRMKYAQRVWIVRKLHAACVYSSENVENRRTLLPPSGALPERYGRCTTLYFAGWLFRNPKGLEKFRDELRAAFTPTDAILRRVESIISPLREAYTTVIGVHIRQADYKAFKGGRFFIGQERVRTILDEYIREKRLDANKAVFVITSDGPIDREIFKGIHIFISKENAVVDLFLLSETDVILGSDSSFGAFASWYGDIPQIILKREPIDWAYYRDKTGHFDNAYSELRP